MIKRENSFSYLRAIACNAVVCLHTVYAASRIFEGSISPAQFTASRSTVNCLMWAVPCFVMVSGALLLNPERELTFRKLFGSYLFRIAGALAIMTLVFRLTDLLMNGEDVSAAGILLGWKEMLAGTSWSHLWYLYLMIGVYLLLPFYKKAAEYSGERELIYLLAVYFVFLSVLPLLSSAAGIRTGFYIHVSTVYPFYLFLGYGLYTYCRKNLSLIRSLILLLLPTAGIILLSIMKYSFGLFETEDFWGYSSPAAILQSIGMFGLFLNLSGRIPQWIGRVLTAIDRSSFGIYLIHMIFVRICFRVLQINPYLHFSVIRFVVVIAVITVLSFCITGLLRKIPGMKKIL